MSGRIIQGGGPIRKSLNVRDSRVHDYPPRWNADCWSSAAFIRPARSRSTLYMGRNAEAAPSLQLLWRHFPDNALVGPEGLFGHIHVEFAELGCMCNITFEGRLRILTLHFKRFIKRLHAE